jgi:hypothetical protein
MRERAFRATTGHAKCRGDSPARAAASDEVKARRYRHFVSNHRCPLLGTSRGDGSIGRGHNFGAVSMGETIGRVLQDSL